MKINLPLSKKKEPKPERQETTEKLFKRTGITVQCKMLDLKRNTKPACEDLR